jgi:alkylhydroperoxidase/carboxymuconolactone decarboxylase family protein YurZ
MWVSFVALLLSIAYFFYSEKAFGRIRQELDKIVSSASAAAAVFEDTRYRSVATRKNHEKRRTTMKITAAFAAACIALMGFALISEAQTMNNQALSAKQQAIVPIAAFTASGELDKLTTSLNEGLDAGLTVNEIKEILVQLYAYAGFPRSLNGIGTFMAVMDERQKRGITDETGKEAAPLPTGRNSIELGTENQTKLAGAPVKGPLFEFAPAIDQFLKGHLFGDIFARDNLDWQSREIATIAALANIEGVNSQLQAHFGIGMNTGLTAAHLKGIIAVLEARVGKRIGDNANEALAKVFSARSK